MLLNSSPHKLCELALTPSSRIMVFSDVSKSNRRGHIDESTRITTLFYFFHSSYPRIGLYMGGKIKLVEHGCAKPLSLCYSCPENVSQKFPNKEHGISQ